LVDPQHGRRDGHFAHLDPPDLMRLWPSTASVSNVQAFNRSAVHRQGPGYRWPAHVIAEPGCRVVRGLEVQDRGARRRTAGPAYSAGCARVAHAYLRSQRHDLSVRRARHRQLSRSATSATGRPSFSTF
jgi:hypothetical protein